MTAIQPARLREQVSKLASLHKNPDEFIRELHGLLNHYGRHVYRAGKAAAPSRLLPSYQTPEPVLRQIELEMTPILEKDTAAGIVICDALWDEAYFELKMLAARIIGKIPPQYSVEALNRIFNWSSQTKDKSLSEALYHRGLVDTISKEPDNAINRVQTWLDSTNKKEKLFGIQIILATLENKNFKNLPLVFGLIGPLVRQAPSDLRPYIIQILIHLTHRTPNETAYFFQQNLEFSIDNDTAWFIRRCLSAFPQPTQESLRASIRKREKQRNLNE
ncbi:MAG: DNA alkylation repair protein [Anaerolineales bacterium]|nr:DNA alkylation repair protein [Anaerolineales bacterium]